MQLSDPASNVVALSDGGALVSSSLTLNNCAASIGDLLRQAARKVPNGVFAAERDLRGDWRRLTYGRALELCGRAGEALLQRGLGPERPLMVIAGNSLNHLVLALAAQNVGVPYAPIAPAYAIAGADRAKLHHVVDLLMPGLIVIDSLSRFENVLPELAGYGVEIVAAAEEGVGPKVTSFRDLVSGSTSDLVTRACAKVRRDTLGKILFTSGSTGMPKAVRHTHGMMVANVEMMVQVWPFLEVEPFIMVDWLPWNHCFGGNNTINTVLRLAGSLYIDNGKPTEALFGLSLKNLGEIAPTFYCNVPKGFALLIDALERNAALRVHFFSRLQAMFYAGASLNVDVWHRLVACAAEQGRGDLPILSGWGSTETGPTATLVMRGTEGPGNIGLPAPGVTLRLAPVGNKLEMRVKSPSVTPGYFRTPETARFDEQGFYCTGDAGRWADPSDFTRGIVYDGRIAEDFKLANGTWVSVGPLRSSILAECDLMQDIVVCGHDQDYLGLLVWPIASTTAKNGAQTLKKISEQVCAYNATRKEASRRIVKLMIMTEPASFEAGEVTEKGTVNQSAVRTRRAALIEVLYSGAPSPFVETVG
jgi:feruloyl-CoA synthase